MRIDCHAVFATAAPVAAPAVRIATYAGVCGLDLVLVANKDVATPSAGGASHDETAANLAALAASAENRRLAPIYWVRPGAPDSDPYAMVGALATEAFCGAMFSPSETAFDVSASLLGPYLDGLAAVSRPAMFRLCAADERQVAPLYAVARQWPQVAFVLCHADADESSRARLRDLARSARQRDDAAIYIDTAHCSSRDVQVQIHEVGVSRVVFGTNALAYNDAHAPRHITLLDELQRTMPTVELNRVLSQTAQALFGLPHATGAARPAPATPARPPAPTKR